MTHLFPESRMDSETSDKQTEEKQPEENQPEENQPQDKQPEEKQPEASEAPESEHNIVPPVKKARTRQNFSWQQISVLEHVFETDQLPHQAKRAHLRCQAPLCANEHRLPYDSGSAALSGAAT